MKIFPKNIDACLPKNSLKTIAPAYELVQKQVMPKPPASEAKKTTAGFFAGIGLMRLGLECEGWSVIYANDIDPEKHEMYQAHFRDTPDHFDTRDIHHVSAADLPTVALATASFPCNDLSLAGMREGLNGEQSSAFWGFTRS